MKKIIFSVLVLAFLSPSLYALDGTEDYNSESEAMAKKISGVEFICSLKEQNCPKEMGCYITPNGTQCHYHGGKTEGDACQYMNDCAPGLMCGGSKMKSCQVICFDDGECPKGQVCAGAKTQLGGGICLD